LILNSKHPLYLTIHGHFYQPPRENPWTGQIEVQDSAAPDHDWNDRIAKQCYTPNSASRILSPWGRIQDIVNNYEYMSFNIGPTLMSWIRKNTPDTYERIREADKNSANRMNGHGNAIAQVYNHMIMPLADRRDRLTQIRWGIADFMHHFGRKPEAMWLAETAVNMDTVVDLIQEGIRFIILSPTQAESFRALPATNANVPVDAASTANSAKGNGEKDPFPWQGCENTDIDTTRPYRIFPRDEKGNPLCEGYLDIFFYHAGLSSAVGFEHLLRDANAFADRIHGSWDAERPEPQLVNIGTDGESYGHHEPYGDMCAAYLYTQKAREMGMVPVNYGWYLEEFPPQHEVKLKNMYSEGCAWSCAHGVGRWYRDCGCSTGAPEGWDQKWRGPLRDAFNHLKVAADEIFEREMPNHTGMQPWEVRDMYGEVLMEEENHEVRHAFLQKVTGNSLPADNAAAASRLLESQKFMLFSYTSCGWFFNDLLGLEPVQNMRYALRSAELLAPWLPGRDLVQEMKDILAKAKSNQNGKTGAEIFTSFVQEKIPVPVRIAAGVATAIYMDLDTSKLDEHTWDFKLEESDKGKSWLRCQISLTHNQTFEQCSVGILIAEREDTRLDYLILEEEDAWEQLPKGATTTAMKKVASHTDNCWVSNMDCLLPDVRNELAALVAERARASVREEMDSFAQRHNLSADFISAGSAVLGDSLFRVMGLSMVLKFKDLLNDLVQSPSVDLLVEAKNMYRELKERNIPLSLEGYGIQFYRHLSPMIAKVLDNPSTGSVRKITELITLADMMGLDINRAGLENQVFESWKAFTQDRKDESKPENQRLKPLFEWLNFDVL